MRERLCKGGGVKFICRIGGGVEREYGKDRLFRGGGVRYIGG